MLQAVEAIIEKNGAVRLLEPVHPSQAMRALLTLVEPVENSPAQKRKLTGVLDCFAAFTPDFMATGRFEQGDQEREVL